ncbi:MAG: outer membrane beta-barrel protein [Bacteroidota bacterium]
MKKILVILLSCCAWSSSFAQGDPHLSLGINATGFVTTFISPNNVQPQAIPLGFWAYYGDRTAARVGVGVSFLNQSNTNSNSDFSSSQFNLDLRLRLGVERRIPVMKRFDVILGLDGIGEQARQIVVTESTFDKTTITTTELGYGLGGILGLQWNMTEKLSLRSEAGLNAMYIESTSKNESQNFPEGDSESTTRGSAAAMDLLSALVLVIHF